MATDYLKFAAYCAYLAAWLVFAIAALVGALRRGLGMKTGMSVSVLVGTLLQILAAYLITRSMASGPLRPRTFELVGTLILAPLGAALFCWALGSVPRDAGAE